MAKWTTIKIALQIALVLVAFVALLNMPDIPSKPPAKWTEFLVLACFAIGLCFGLGLSHLFPTPEVEP